ncbi:RagB/SusD family nutrient uptake outer membrane protein [Dyadobacter sp. CY345]|uniref:RagB/SusD family nutrient uptake outer membrane protein n=1 Tax=Dyadobacter sp. CY345 TaxID=2909335 RepID=UPI001F421605|nr:RagB/SusD family nutrient uptake outer membrane protein [Dyadobacter sp. CY345]MCF2446749.1 RagB/SusD family nutrient uptake outer membrane protein [Dyadobacter sp. CY345]
MKNIISKPIILIIGVLLFTACKEEKFLKEEPLDFYSPENSFINAGNFDAALTDLYARIRAIQSVDGGASLYSEVLGTDLAFNARLAPDRMGSYAVALTPQGNIPNQHWIRWYKIIANANTIISRAATSSLTEAQKTAFSSEAKLFRAYAYFKLVHLFGDVPLIVEEISNPKSDFTRAPKVEVLNQIVADATDAATNLPNVDAVKDGKLSKAVANHLLAETYISLKDYDKAIAAATEVIEKSNLQLMTDRFGSLRNSPGDVYYDLFRVGNQNRKSGNLESIWVIQYELDVIGGVLTSSGSSLNNLERSMGPASFSIVDPDGKASLVDGASASTLNSGGRGVGFVQPTDYWTYEIWGLDPKNDNRKLDASVTDIRTSPFNIPRDFIYTNPLSPNYFGKSLLDFPAPNWNNATSKWRWFPYPSKITTPGQHPVGVVQDQTKLTLKATAGATFRDMYMIRLPETILLRAEAYLLKGNNASAASDINLVRNRAKAKPVTAAEVTLDYILDERARELMYEEDRRITLSRMGKLVERVKKYNALSGPTIQAFHALFPIPFSEIQANKDAVLEQNPGY